MKLTLERIGAIDSASIELGGLTVIAGENDTGKSTLGKVFFALVQAFSTFPIAVKKNNSFRLRRELEMLYFDIRRTFDVAEFPEIRRFFSGLRTHTDDVQNLPFAEIAKLIQTLEQKAAPAAGANLTISRKTAIERRMVRLQKEFVETQTDEVAIAKLVHQALSSEFAGEIQSSSQNAPARISLADGATTILDMEITNTNVVKFVGGDPLGLRDATLVDGPSILQLYPAIDGYDGLGFEERTSYRRAIPYHVVDLANKLKGARSALKFTFNQKARVFNVFDGEVFFDEENESFYLKRGNLKVPSVNIASGIKALSIVEMLYSGDYIADDTLLILDEPETNLHPKWQISYAKTICELVRDGAKILVTTHSPYMLEALRGYCNEEIDSKFYLAKKEDEGATRYIDTFGDILPIVDTLSKPLSDFIQNLDGEEF